MMQAILESLPSRTVFSSSIASFVLMAGPEALAELEAAAEAAALLEDAEPPAQPASIAPAPAMAAAAAVPVTNVRLETIES